jgi:hypothetical protein
VIALRIEERHIISIVQQVLDVRVSAVFGDNATPSSASKVVRGVSLQYRACRRDKSPTIGRCRNTRRMKTSRRIRGRKTIGLSEARRQELCFAAAIERYDASKCEVRATVAREGEVEQQSSRPDRLRMICVL